MHRLTLSLFFGHLVTSIVVAELPLDEPWWPKASPLPQPAGKVIRVATVDNLYEATRGLEEGTTVLIADGVYQMPAKLEIAGTAFLSEGLQGIAVESFSIFPSRDTARESAYARAKAPWWPT